jgi:hypothetical protein
MMGFGTFTGLFFKRLPLNMVMLPINAIVLYFVLRAIAALYQKMGYGALR